MNKWHIDIVDSAENDLREIYEYIANTLLEPQIALKLIRRIKSKILKLDTSPTMYAIYPTEPWKSRGLRRVNSGNYAIFFIPTENGKQAKSFDSFWKKRITTTNIRVRCNRA